MKQDLHGVVLERSVVFVLLSQLQVRFMSRAVFAYFAAACSALCV